MVAPRMASPAINGRALKSVRSMVADICANNVSVAETSAKLKPPELRRLTSVARNSFRGKGNFPFAFSEFAWHTETGSATTSSIEISASAMRFTNEEFAPFSSSRRTRYGSKSSWLPTGA